MEALAGHAKGLEPVARWPKRGLSEAERAAENCAATLSGLRCPNLGLGRVRERTCRFLFENGRFLPVKALPLGPVPWSIEGTSGKRVDQPRDGLFHLTEGAFRRAIDWTTLGRRIPLSLCCPSRTGAACGLASLRVAWHISKTGKFADRTPTSDGLGKGRVEALYFEASGARFDPDAPFGSNRRRAEPESKTAGSRR